MYGRISKEKEKTIKGRKERQFDSSGYSTSHGVK
jgi:hypothetical protein